MADLLARENAALRDRVRQLERLLARERGLTEIARQQAVNAEANARMAWRSVFIGRTTARPT